MADQPAQELFLGRQPILDRRQNLAAFELLFRSGHFNGAQIEDDVFASATVINHAFSELGVEAVLGRHPGFINLTAPLIMSEGIELLPKGKVVLEILETVRVTDPLAQRCRALKRMGFTLALDDVTDLDAELRPLLEVVDIVKVDVQHMQPEQLTHITAALKSIGVRLLAEKIDSRSQLERCLDLGYELFQGYYFAHPTVITGRRPSHAQSALMHLLGVLTSDVELPRIEAGLMHEPDLEANLLKLLNCAAAGAVSRIRSLREGASVLGAAELRRWLHVLLFTLGTAPTAEFPSPLVILAATRGRMMELIAHALQPDDATLHQRAFIAGLLSLVNALLGMPIGEIVEAMPVDAKVKAALVERGGALGAMLLLVEALEEAELAGIERALDRVRGLAHGQVIGMQVEAMRWANSIGEAA